MTEKKISETVFSQRFDPLSYWIEQDQAIGDLLALHETGAQLWLRLMSGSGMPCDAPWTESDPGRKNFWVWEFHEDSGTDRPCEDREMLDECVLVMSIGSIPYPM